MSPRDPSSATGELLGRKVSLRCTDESSAAAVLGEWHTDTAKGDEMNDDLIPWLRAQLDDDERRINEHPLTTYFYASDHDEYRATMGGTNDPVLTIGKTRALAEVDAKRRILALHEQYRDKTNDCAVCFQTWPCGTVRLLALPYADRPGYREEWRP